MAREKKPVHKLQMTEGKREIIQSSCSNIKFSQRRTYRKPSKICLAEQSRR